MNKSQLFSNFATIYCATIFYDRSDDEVIKIFSIVSLAAAHGIVQQRQR